VTDLSKQQLRQLATVGAMARLEELRIEEAAIRQAFPELGRRPSPAPVVKATAAEVVEREPEASAGGRNRMSPSARKAVSERMKKYWAERRKARGAKK
jgi:hypothetical protein